MDSTIVTKCRLHFFFLANNHETSNNNVFMYTVSQAATLLSLRWERRCQNQHEQLLDKYSHQVLGLSR